MKRIRSSFLIGLFLCVGSWPAHEAAGALQTGTPQTRVVGDVSAVEAAANQLTITTSAGSVIVKGSDSTSVLRLPPGASADKAVKINLQEISVGERVFARGEISTDGKVIAARQIVVTAATAPSDWREEWRTRGIAGRITEINSNTKQIVIATRQRDGVDTVNLDVSGNVRFFRHAPDSFALVNVRPSTFEELRVGDQLRALGNKSEDARRFTAEEVLSVSFIRSGGVVTKTNPATSEIAIRTPQGEKLRIAIGKRTTLKRVTNEAAAAFRETRQVTATKVADTSSSQPPRGKVLQEMVERLPGITVVDLGKGDTVLLSGTYEKDRSRVTAVLVLTGEADFLKQFLVDQPGRGPQNPGLPGDILGGGIFDRDEP